MSFDFRTKLDETRQILTEEFGGVWHDNYLSYGHYANAVLKRYGKPMIRVDIVPQGFYLDIYPTETAKAVYSTPLNTHEDLESLIHQIGRFLPRTRIKELTLF